MAKRLYPHNRVRYWYAYDLEEICALFSDTGLHIQTVRKWIKKDGLATIDNGKPALIYGNDLITFLKRQNGKGKCKTEFDHFFCMACKDARPVFQNKVQLDHKSGFLKGKAFCRSCKSQMFKSYKLADLGRLKRCFQLVDVLELYDNTTPTVKTHFPAPMKTAMNESIQPDLFAYERQ